MKKLGILILLAAAYATSLQAEVYTYIDAEGNRVFTDSPPRGNAERIQLHPQQAELHATEAELHTAKTQLQTGQIS